MTPTLLVGIYSAVAVTQTRDVYSPVQNILMQQDPENEPFSQGESYLPPGAEGYEVNQVQEKPSVLRVGMNGTLRGIKKVKSIRI